jgi:excisionase family DNA binding protein
MEKGYMSAKEAAEYMGVHVKTFYSLCQLEGLKHTRVGSRPGAALRTKTAWIDEWMDSRVVEQKF